MNTKRFQVIKRDTKGQTLVVMVFLMIFATAIGVTISSRFLNTLRGFVRTDDSTKALKAAEAIIERTLIVPSDTLSDYITFGNCGDACVYTINEPSGNVVRATVALSLMGNTPDPFSVNVRQGEVGQVNLTGYSTNSTFDICWDGTSSVYALYVYTDAGVIKSKPYAYNSSASPYFGNGFGTSSANHGYTNCFTVNTTGSPKYARLRSYYDNTHAYVVPLSGQVIPTQGIMMDAYGYSGQQVKHVKVLKTDPSALPLFDYALLQTSDTYDLTNSYPQD